MQPPLWQATVFTLFPEIFPGPLGCSILGNVLDQGVSFSEDCNIRDYAEDRQYGRRAGFWGRTWNGDV